MGLRGNLLTYLALIVVLVLGFIYMNKAEHKADNFVIIQRIIDGDDVWEERVKFPDGTRELYKNNIKIMDIPGLKIETALPILELPKTVEIGVNIEDEMPIQALTWASNLEKSAKYLNYLKNSGFKQLRMTQTPSYIEVYMGKDDAIKRLIIFKDVIMIGDLVIKELEPIKWQGGKIAWKS